MVDKNDWRLVGQEKYLYGATLRWKRYTPPSEEWDHDHCVFCWAKFMDVDRPNILREGYATEDNCYWICEQCFGDFKEMFQWRLADNT
jgi:hypothetical protein